MVYADFLRLVMEIVNTGLSGGTHHNPHLIYAVLHKRELLAPYKGHAHLADVVESIELVCLLLGSRLSFCPPFLSHDVFLAVPLFPLS